MPYYRKVGDVPPKRHTQHRQVDGRLFYEELVGEEGFSSISALMYHQHIPSAIVSAEEWNPGEDSTKPNAPLRPRHFRLHETIAAECGPSQADLVTGRRLILANADVRLLYVTGTTASPLYRSALGDELIFVEHGQCRVETTFGVLEVHDGDYLNIPSGTTHRFVPLDGSNVSALIIEASGHIIPPRRYMSASGQMLEHAPYCERDMHAPTEPLIVGGDEVEVLVKHRARHGVAGTRFVMSHHPFDVVGWDGCVYPWKLSIHDFEPITGRVHQPPPSHQVFEGPNFVVCNFVPRKVDYHPLAIPVPYYHSNVDSDEVIFYVYGDYQARKGSGIGPGSVSLHPSGHTHGPQPGAIEASLGVDRVDELAVMVDTFRPVEIGTGGAACEDLAYAWSWARGTTGS